MIRILATKIYKNMKAIIVLLAVMAATFSSCDESVPEPKKTATAIYVAGNDGYKATYWKNGVATNLTNGVNRAVAQSIYVSGKDIHVAGSEIAKGKWRARYWKNGIVTNLTNGPNSSSAFSVFVSGSDVYVAGNDGLAAICWKNGIATTLGFGRASSVFVSGSDVYVAGQVGHDATYWKNGVATTLAAPAESHNSANSIFVSGKDVYVAGNHILDGTSQHAIYWKNGVATLLANNHWSFATSIFAARSNVYVASCHNDPLVTAKYWKNDNPISLVEGESGGAHSIFVSGSNVYVAGSQGSFAKYWKNGVPTSLTNVEPWAAAYSIFVTEITSADSSTDF